MRAAPPRPALGALPAWRRGLSLVEVLVALAIMATVAAALFGLQAASLRAARTAAITRQQAAELRYEASLARLVTAPATGCRGAQPLGTCALTTTCLAVGALPEGCDLWQTTVEVTGPSGRSVALTTVAYGPLEAAPVGLPASEPHDAAGEAFTGAELP